MPKPTLAGMIAANLRAAQLAEDRGDNSPGWLIRYAERVARKTEVNPLPMRHLYPAARVFERALAGEEVRALISIPVRHGKTTLAKAAILGGLRRNPRMRINYASYAADLAEAKMFEVRQLADGEGLRLDPNFQTDPEWRTVEGGAVKSGGLIGGPWNGQGANWNLLDDPYKNAEQAYSLAYRIKTREQFDSAFMTRLEPGGSAIVLSARWCDPDLMGELAGEGWEVINLPALDTQDRPLWPERWQFEALDRIRKTNPFWWSLYQGQPKPEGSQIFDENALGLYNELPKGPFVEVMGIDVAYGAKKQHDRSALVVWRRYLAEPRVLYLVECWVGHEPVELFACRVAEVQLRRGNPTLARLRLPRTKEEIDTVWRPQLTALTNAQRIRARWYGSTTEEGAAGLMSAYGAQIEYARATVDKLARAQAGGYVSAWGEGRIRWPANGGEHVDRLLSQHRAFTGLDGGEDDGVDAGVAGHDIAGIPPPPNLSGGRARVLNMGSFNSREG